MKNSKSDAAKVAAAVHLMDRGWGKAEQKIEAEHVIRYVADVPEVAASVDAWQKQHEQTTLQ